MSRVRGSVLPWLIAAGGLTAAWIVWRRSHRPYYPDVALGAGLELLSRRRRVLAIGPHPADLECFAGGTLKLMTQNGSPVTMAVLSRGERATNRANIAEIRTRETESAAAVLAADLIQLDLPDGAIRPGPELDRALDDLWTRAAPEVVLAFDPKGPLPFANHPDHLALGAALLTRIQRGTATGERVYLYGSPAPNVLVDITEVLEEKTTALMTHRSQLRGPDAGARAFARRVSRLHSGSTPAMYTEAFYRLV
jgi:LmbE family N-acetylglucosaminyl deacetylase